MKFSKWTALGLALVLAGCSGAPSDTEPETTSEADSIKLTQLIVNADGTTEQHVEYVTRAQWKVLLAAKERGATESPVVKGAQQVADDLTITTGSSCLGSDLWLYSNTDGWNSGPPQICVRGTGSWEADPPGCTFLCFGFKSYWPGSSAGSFNPSENQSCSTVQGFQAWSSRGNINHPNPVWVNQPIYCTPD